MGSRREFLLASAALLLPPGVRAGDERERLLGRLRKGGHVLLMRHASTEPGLGDPQGYRLDDCRTQRNLSAAGREEARRAGARLREAGVPIAKVFTSPWCRCRDTAREAFGAAEEWEALGSIFDFPDREPDYSERVRKRVGRFGAKPPPGNVAMVTHNVNIAALTGHSVAPAEMVVVRPDGCCGLRAVGRLVLYR